MLYHFSYFFYASVSALVLWIAVTLVYVHAKKINKWAIIDIFWGMGFVLVALIGWGLFLNFQVTTQALPVLFISLWGIRLTGYLGKRVLSIQEDERYTRLKEASTSEFSSYMTVFVLQAFFIWLLCMPLYFYLTLAPIAIEHLSSKIFLGLGSLMCLWGLAWEWGADFQLKKFKKPNQLVQEGLWQYSRHPNYFGEICFWLGIWLMTRFILPENILLTVLLSIITAISPMIISVILFKITGPMLEKSMEKYSEWEKYKEHTPYICPKFK